MKSVAIIMRTKDRPALLRRALLSVAAQTFTDWHLVIVNHNAPREPVEKLVSETAHIAGKVTLVEHCKPSREAGYQIGINASESTYICMHDDDDTWEPDFLEKTVAYLRNSSPEVYGVVTKVMCVHETMKKGTPIELSRTPFFPEYASISIEQLAAYNVFPPIAFLFRRDALSKVGPYRADIPVLADWDFHLRFALEYDIDVIPEFLANYHIRPESSHLEYANTITREKHLHTYYKNMLLQEAIREDYHSGKIGKGILMLLAAQTHTLDVRSTQILQHRNRIERILHSLFGKR
ncbi:MAG: glycosyltransferase [Patescibacteria group bacterium]|nr:glycosyltransferase [Patescibacteria group bacterium]